MRAKINSGHGRHPQSVKAPKSSGRPSSPVPRGGGGSLPTSAPKVDYAWRNRLAGIGRKGKMY